MENFETWMEDETSIPDVSEPSNWQNPTNADVKSFDTGVVGYATTMAFGNELIASSASSSRLYVQTVQQQARDFQLKHQQTTQGVVDILANPKICREDGASIRAAARWERAELIGIAAMLKQKSMLELEALID